MAGVVKHAKKKGAILQVGNIVEVERFRRLETQLGTLSVDLLYSPSAACFVDMARLQILHYLAEMLTKGMQDGEPHPHLYRATKQLLETIEQDGLWERLGFYELQLLSELGFGLSLDKSLAVVDEDEKEAEPQLAYVSPKTGRAVSEKMGAPYKDKLLPLPKVFGGKSEEILDVFKLTGYFLDRAYEGKPLDSRTELISLGVKSEFKDS